ncbi:MAG TPA: glycosyltransferase family 4 protein [Candidatus Polarisedimenticolia bacterium]|nr:glycosyltransferase family 4 protein [Candidatus Polarisedimenticolia bacterium]
MILFVSERADFFGGGQRSLFDLARALRSARPGAVPPCEPLVLLPGDGPLAAACAGAGIATAFLPLPPVAGGALFAAPRALASLARLAHRHDVDLFHSDSPRTALYAGTAAGLLDRPHLWHVRASRPSSEFADAALLALSDLVVAVSRAAARRSAALTRSPRVRVVPTGLAPPACRPRSEARALLRVPEDAFVAGVVGRVEPDKGVEEAVAALPLVRDIRPDAHLVFVGPVDEASPCARDLMRLAERQGVAPAVRLAGGRDDAATLLSAFDVLLHPSRHEALPRAVLEALHAGIPVVAAAVGGVPEAIADGRSGLLVPPGHATALGEAARRLARDPALASSLAAAGRERARTLFSLEGMTAAIAAIYDELLGEGAAPAREEAA